MPKEGVHDFRTAIDHGWRLILGILTYSKTAETRRDVFVYDISAVGHRLEVTFEITVQGKWDFVCSDCVFEFDLFTWRRIADSLRGMDFAVGDVVF